jgi:hypothetical protein
VGLLVLGFHRIVGFAAVNVEAIYTDAHESLQPNLTPNQM